MKCRLGIIPNCKICGSTEVVRYGTSKGIQRWWCKTCQHKFIDNNAISNMRVPKDQIASAINEYYDGSSINEIRRSLQQQYNSFISESTIYAWIINFSKYAISEANQTQVSIGDRWILDETVIKIGGKEFWLIDIVDTCTRFLLARKLTVNRNIGDVVAALEIAKARAGRIPVQIITDQWKGYISSLELSKGFHTEHIQVNSSDQHSSLGLIELWQITLRDRLKIMRGLKKEETAYIILDGLFVHYNFFRAQESLGYRTPAQLANASFLYRSWLDVISKSYQLSTGVDNYHNGLEKLSDLVSEPIIPVIPETAGIR